MLLNNPAVATDEDSLDGFDAEELMYPFRIQHWLTAQTCYWGDNSTTATSQTVYLGGLASAPSATVGGFEFLVPRDGRLANFRLDAAANGITATSTITIRKNDTAIVTVTLGSGVLSNQDLTTLNAFVSAGDRISVRLVTGASGTTITRLQVTFDYQVRVYGTRSPVGTIYVGQVVSISAGGTYNIWALGSTSGGNTNQRMTISGLNTTYLKHLRFHCTSNSFTAECTVQVLLDGVPSESLILTIPAGETDVSLPSPYEVTFSGATLVLQLVVPSSPGGTMVNPLIVVEAEEPTNIQASSSQEFIMLGASAAINSGLTRYLSAHGLGVATAANVRKFYVTRGGVVASLQAIGVTNTLDGSTVVTVRKNNVDTAMTVTIAAGSTLSQSTISNTFAVVPGDYLEVMVVTAGTTGNINIAAGITIIRAWSLTGYFGIKLPVIKQDGRLTLSSGIPVTTSDVIGGGTLSYTPNAPPQASNGLCSGDGARVTLFNGSDWVELGLIEVELTLSGLLTSGKNYDVFLYTDDGETLKLALGNAWTNDITRADTLTVHPREGIRVLASDPRKRLVGTIRATGTGTTEDSAAKRFVLNEHNQVEKPSRAKDVTASWTYVNPNSVWRRYNNAAASKAEALFDGRRPGKFSLIGEATAASGTQQAACGIGTDWVSGAPHADCKNGRSGVTTVLRGPFSAFLSVTPVAGYHTIDMLEWGASASVTYTFFGASATGIQTGLDGTVWV